jgi:hypothetical protein
VYEPLRLGVGWHYFILYFVLVKRGVAFNKGVGMSNNELPCSFCGTSHHPADECFPSELGKVSTAKQIDGDHYVKMGIQPWEIIEKNKLDYWEGNALKYVMRWRSKDGIIDLDKAIHEIEHIKALAKKGHYGEQFKEVL